MHSEQKVNGNITFHENLLQDDLYTPQIQLTAFFSTPSFIRAMTQLSLDILSEPTLADKRKRLNAGLSLINESLPAAVYVPFLQSRHQSVLQIAVDATKLFITAHRAPFCVVCEVWNPATEIQITEQDRNSHAQKLVRKHLKQLNQG